MGKINSKNKGVLRSGEMIEKKYVCKVIRQYFTEKERNYDVEYSASPTRLNALYLAKEKENHYAVSEALKKFTTKYGDRGDFYLKMIAEYFGKYGRSAISLSMEYCLSESSVYAVIRDFVHMTADELGIRLK